MGSYILLNKVEFDRVWETDIRPPDYEGTPAVLDVVFVMDIAASMASNDPKWLRKDVSKGFVDKLGQDDRAALVIFTRVAAVRPSLTSSKASLVSAINGLANDSGYNTYSGTDGSVGINAALDILTSQSRDAHKYIVFLTDGYDNQHTFGYDTLIDRANGNSIVVYTIGLGSTVDSQQLRKIAPSTGGKYYTASTAGDLVSAFDSAATETIDFTTDTDGISDYYEREIAGGTLRLGNGIALRGLDHLNPDSDGDGLLDGEEIIVTVEEIAGAKVVYVKMLSNPLLRDSDGDGLDDREDPLPLVR